MPTKTKKPSTAAQKDLVAHFAQAVDRAQDAFNTEIARLAEKVRVEILPYFKEHNLDFAVGAGWGWCITRSATKVRSTEEFVQDEELPLYIRKLLNLEVAYNNQLGLHIRPIKRGDWK